jgi:hypothetical protein
LNPVDSASSRFKQIRQAQADIEKAEAAQAAARERVVALSSAVGPAERRDREALAKALIACKDPPSNEAERLQAELAEAERGVEALNEAVQMAYEKIPRLVRENRHDWTARTERELHSAAKTYNAAIDELERTRAELGDLAGLRAWIQTGDMAEVASDALAGETGEAMIRFGRTLEMLRADVGHLASYAGRESAPLSGHSVLDFYVAQAGREG